MQNQCSTKANIAKEVGSMKRTGQNLKSRPCQRVLTGVANKKIVNQREFSLSRRHFGRSIFFMQLFYAYIVTIT